MRFTMWVAAVVGLAMLLAAAGSGCGYIGRAMTRFPDDGVRWIKIETSMGVIVIEPDPEHAPITVANFLAYVRRDAYDGTIFHRVVDNCMIQGGGWTPELVNRAKLDKQGGGPDVPIKNEWQNGLKNVRGTIAMARGADPDSATREFFINVRGHPRFDTPREEVGNAGYAVFGRVVQGMDIVDMIAHVPTTSVTVPGVEGGTMENVPVEPVVIFKMGLIIWHEI